MNESPKEQLSALIDGELERDSARFLMKRMESDTELRGAWERWQLAGACLRRQPAYDLPESFAAGIARRIADEPAPRATAAFGGVLRWAAGLAVAASVALAALVVVQPVTAPEQGEVSLVAAPVAPAAVVEASPVRAEDLRPDLGPATQVVSGVRSHYLGPALPSDPQLDAYLVRHGAALGAGRSVQVVPYVHLLQAPVATRAALRTSGESASPR